MSGSVYQFFGVGVAPIRGREKEMAKIRHRLEADSPGNVSVVGPRYIGKTVFLNAVAAHFSASSKHFDSCLYWNVGHHTPEDDSSFYREFAKQVSKALTSVNPEVAEYLNSDEADYEILADGFSTLAEKGQRLLAIVDSLENLRYNAKLTKNLWDSLRALAEMPSLRFLMGSQIPLHEVCALPEARTSPFWNLFPETITIAAFNEDDWAQMLAPFTDRGIGFDKGARTELLKATGGIPFLLSALCERLWEETPSDSLINDETIQRLLKRFDGDKTFVDRMRDKLDDLWAVCEEEERGVIAELSAGTALESGSMSRPCLLSLKTRGVVREEGRALKLCTTVDEYVKLYNRQATELPRLFGSKDHYDRNIKTVLKLRFNQLQGVDERLLKCVKYALEKFDEPELVVQEIRGLVNLAFAFIWDRELPDRQIPPDWTAAWKMPDLDGYRAEIKPPEGRVPGGGARCYLLNLMTDTRKAGTTRVSRPTFYMIDYLHSVGDFGQHLDGTRVPEGFIHSVCLTAIEMCEQLAKDFSE
jgi:Cdc6-like AAA superfamily ATPase